MEYLRPLQRTGDASLLAYGHAERDGHIAFATAYLAGAPNVHSGGFAAPIRETRSWRAFLDIIYAMDDARSATPLRPLRISTAMRTAVRTFDTLPGFPLRAHAASGAVAAMAMRRNRIR